MFKRNVKVLHDLGKLSDKASLRTESFLIYGNVRKIFTSRYALYYVFFFRIIDIACNQCTAVCRVIGISDIYRNVCLFSRKYRFLMKNLSPHIRKFPKLFIRYLAYLFRIFYNARICHQKARYIRPIFVYISIYGSSHKRSSDIGTSS